MTKQKPLSLFVVERQGGWSMEGGYRFIPLRNLRPFETREAAEIALAAYREKHHQQWHTRCEDAYRVAEYWRVEPKPEKKAKKAKKKGAK